MKNTFIAIMLLLLTSCAFSQVTKSDVESMLTQQGSSMQKITEFYVSNLISHFSNGTWDRSNSKYTSAKGNTFDLVENGIRVVYKPASGAGSITLYPYNKIKELSVGATFINIMMAD